MIENNIGCVLLASGISSRFKENKLLSTFEGELLFERTLGTIPSEIKEKTVVVTAYKKIKEIAEEKGFLTLWNDSPEKGISHTIKLGLSLLKETEGCMFCVCDQPLRRKESIEKLLRCFNKHKKSIVALSYEGKKGNPVIFPKDLFPAFFALEGDKGGNVVIQQHLERLVLCNVANPLELYDIDTVEDLIRLEGKSLKNMLKIHKGVTAFVGGGGKTTAIYTLAKELYEQGNTVIVTTTTKMYTPKPPQVRELMLSTKTKEIKKAVETFGLIAVGKEIVQGKLIGLESEIICEMAFLADYVLVEADGAKQLPIKVPAVHEPVIPSCTGKVVAVVGMRAYGKAIEEVCFRGDRAAKFLGKSKTDLIDLEDMAKIIVSPEGLAKGSANKPFEVLINQADEQADQERAYILSEKLKLKGIEHSVIASLHKKIGYRA